MAKTPKRSFKNLQPDTERRTDEAIYSKKKFPNPNKEYLKKLWESFKSVAKNPEAKLQKSATRDQRVEQAKQIPKIRGKTFFYK